MSNLSNLIKINSTPWRYYKKFAPIYARRVTTETVVHTLEGDIILPIGHYLCQSVDIGEEWGQAEERLLAKYVKVDKYLDKNTNQTYVPNPEQEGVVAMEMDNDFSVPNKLGELGGKGGHPGDFLVTDYSNKNVLDESRMWVVGHSFFVNTYALVKE